MRAQANWARFDEDQVGAVNVNDVADAMTDEPTPNDSSSVSVIIGSFRAGIATTRKIARRQRVALGVVRVGGTRGARRRFHATLDAADARLRLVSQDGILQAVIEFSD